MSCICCELTKERDDFLFESKHFQVYLSENQSYLGRFVVVLKRHVSKLSDLTNDEMLDFAYVIKVMEKTLTEAFGATMFNWCCLMNNAYKKSPPNPHVHWHCRPRYKKEVKFAGMLFSDKDFAHHYNNKKKMFVNLEVKKEIISRIKELIMEFS
ncbi:MAG: HIT family protein [Candidatus Heimdallarchaeaceae archaeon]